MYAWEEEGSEHVERRDVCLREVGSRGFSQVSSKGAGQLTLSTSNDWDHC